MVYIYALEDPRDSQIRYVGKTVDLKHRMNYHFNPHISDSNIHKKNWINSVKSEGLLPNVIILEELDIDNLSKDWIPFEIYWISQMRQWGFNLVNYSNGGDSPPINTSWGLDGRDKLVKTGKYKTRRTIDVYYNDEYIGRFVGVNNFIRDYLKFDRYLDKRDFKQFSSKITACLKGRKKQYKNYKFELVC